MVELIHMSPRWGLRKGNIVFLQTCRPAGAEAYGEELFYKHIEEIPKQKPVIGLKRKGTCF